MFVRKKLFEALIHFSYLNFGKTNVVQMSGVIEEKAVQEID